MSLFSEFKDPCIFVFLSIGEKAKDREVEKTIIAHMEEFLLELGAGFAFQPFE
jgi:predicted nuclease of restriction endonuclease-like (RecB) superfamily